MVLTRSQVKRGRSSNAGDDDGSSVVGSLSTNAESSDSEGVNPRPAAKLRSSAAMISATSGSLAGEKPGASLPTSLNSEPLGRGCRVSRASASLDEEYLATSLSRSKALQRILPPRGSAAVQVEQTRSGGDRDDIVTTRSRYPQREAAKRAMENLRNTLSSVNRANGRGGGAAAHNEGDSRKGMGVFNFRHHPELKEVINKMNDTQWHRCRNSSSSSDDSDSDNDEEEDESDTSYVSQGSVEADVPASRATGRRPRCSTAPLSSPAALSLNSRTTAATRRARAADGDAVSINSSISDASMREESVERMAQQDRRIELSLSSSESNEGECTGELIGAQRRRAVRNARESVSGDININHYMADAVGVEDSRKIRRRQLDRRYRWLLHQEEDARARAEGYSGGSGSVDGVNGSATGTTNEALGSTSPLHIHDGITFDSVGGLTEHIVTLREMVLLPLLYPDLFERLDLKAPRGVLFVGPPGTGKTLMARALANEGSQLACGTTTDRATPLPGRQRIAFFLCKGADILSKWVGESERQLKLLFEAAKRVQPSIIFFDEVDGLAPMRHAKAEQTHTALVSTLLALLDGLEDRGQVVVIGATNRPDTLDPALRRPGRFDRELVFPLPDAAARRHILTIQLAKKTMPVNAAERAALLEDLVEMTEGYTGADLSALCTEASLHRLRTALPQLYLSQQRLIVPREVEQAQLQVRTEDFYAAAQVMQPSLRRNRSRCPGGVADSFLDPYIEVLLRGTRDATLEALAPSWSIIDKALRAGSRNCQDMATAVRSLCAVPVPQPPRPCLLVLREASAVSSSPFCTIATATAAPTTPMDRSAEQHQQQRALRLHHLAVALLKALPRLPHLFVHLPQLSWSDSKPRGLLHDVAAVPEDYLGDPSGSYFADGSFTHMSHVVDSVRRCSPCIVYLSGAEEWLRGGDAEAGTPATDLSSDDDKVMHLGSESSSPTGALHSNVPTTPADVKAAIVDEEHAAPIHRKRPSRRQQRLVQLFRYYLDTLADTDVVFLLPCASAATCELLIGVDCSAPVTSELRVAATASSLQQLDTLSPSSPSLVTVPPGAVQLSRCSMRQQRLHPSFSVVFASVPITPLPRDLRSFVVYVYRIVAMTLQLHCRATVVTAARGPPNEHRESETAMSMVGPASALVVDTAPPSSPLSASNLRARRRADHAHRCELWRKVEYRRLQLRHVLIKWVSQYINSGKFKLLASADLDLTADDPQLKSWQQHTRHHRIGLQDVLEKIEDEKYVCLSQYHDDIDQLVRNVRSFFRTRATQDQRYRLKALDLKETCLLNMYKMSRAVIRFCEETRDVCEPSSEEDTDDMREGRRVKVVGPGRDHTAPLPRDADPTLIAEQSRRAMSFSQRPTALAQRKPRRYYGERRRRRRPRKVPKTETNGTPNQVGLLNGDDRKKRDEQALNAASASQDELVAEEVSRVDNDYTPTSGADKGTSTVSTISAAAQDWACDHLASLSYTRLHQVFKLMMRGLEVEVRRVGCTVAPTALPHPSEQVNGVAGTTPRLSEDSEQHPDLYIATTFRQLLLAALGE
ncbi:hypothetical protein JKF63_07036 [Porcisia hertigi]|uniref:AAA+ ATPase domain-containing protein n=1 Tax=Porcisia hertigi TaxID=2761500 RepID=A0A836LHD9_9TRYP|nr:hypothetical protein JKF63_07036 [Porcisia hertigi]